MACINEKALALAAKEGVSSLIVIKIGDTVESSIILDGKVFNGFSGLGGRIGHMIIDHDGLECVCGNKGCFEAYVTPEGVKKQYAQAAAAAGKAALKAEEVTLETVFAAADKGDAAAIAAKNSYVAHLASALTDIINLFQTEKLFVCGDLSKLGDALIKPTMDIVLADQYTRHSPNKCEVRFCCPGCCCAK